MRLWFSGPRILRGLVRPSISIGREDGNPRLPSNRRYELRHGLHEAAKDYCIDKALATGLLDNGNLNLHLRGTREEVIAGILTTAKAWGQLMTCDQAEHLADRAIRKARWRIDNLITIALIVIFLHLCLAAVAVATQACGSRKRRASEMRLRR